MALFVLLGFSACKSTRVATTSTGMVKPISSQKLIRNMEDNAFDYSHLAIKRMVCQFDNGKIKTSFRGNLQAQKDEQITLMLTKLNIPVARLWLTPDSVKFINYLEENYFLGNYSFLSSLIDMKLDFETVNAVISNDVFSLTEQSNAENGDYKTSIEDGMYVLESVLKPNSGKVNPTMSTKKALRGSKNLSGGAPVIQRLYVHPLTFKLHKITLEDARNARKMNIDFSDFVEVGKQLYPGEIALDLTSPQTNMQLNIKMSNFSLEKERGVRFKVPENFTPTSHE